MTLNNLNNDEEFGPISEFLEPGLSLDIDLSKVGLDIDLSKVGKGIKDCVKGVVKNPVYSIINTMRQDESTTDALADKKIFTYVEALEYAIDKKSTYPEIESTILRVENSSGELSVTQVFSDRKGELVQKGKGYLGRKVTAREIDEELQDVFGDQRSTIIDLPQHL